MSINVSLLYVTVAFFKGDPLVTSFDSLDHINHFYLCFCTYTYSETLRELLFFSTYYILKLYHYWTLLHFLCICTFLNIIRSWLFLWSTSRSIFTPLFVNLFWYFPPFIINLFWNFSLFFFHLVWWFSFFIFYLVWLFPFLSRLFSLLILSWWVKWLYNHLFLVIIRGLTNI